MKDIFEKILKGKVVVLGVGNIIRGDDGLGPALVKGLQARTDMLCFDAGTAPENYLGKIARAKPDVVLIVDAVDLGLEPGAYKILKKEDIVKSGFSTHDLSPHLFIEFLEKETAADIYMLAIQPENVGFGEEMSQSVKKRLEEARELIINNA